MLKENDKDAIIEFLKAKLKQIVNYELTAAEKALNEVTF